MIEEQLVDPMKIEATKRVTEEMSRHYYLNEHNVKEAIDRSLKGKNLEIFANLLKKESGQVGTFLRSLSFQYYFDLAMAELEDEAFMRLCKTCDGHGCQHCEDDHG